MFPIFVLKWLHVERCVKEAGYFFPIHLYIYVILYTPQELFTDINPLRSQSRTPEAGLCLSCWLACASPLFYSIKKMSCSHSTLNWHHTVTSRAAPLEKKWCGLGGMALWVRTFTLQAWGSEFKSQHPCKKPGRQVDTWDSWEHQTLVHFPTLILISAHITLKIKDPKTQMEMFNHLSSNKWA